MTDDKKKPDEYLDRPFPELDEQARKMGLEGRKMSVGDIIDPPEFVIKSARQISVK